MARAQRQAAWGGVPFPYPAHCFEAVLRLTLPWPGSGNRYWRTPRTGKLAGRRVLSNEAYAYRKKVALCVADQLRPHIGPLRGHLAVHVLPYGPAVGGTIDVDNLFKPLLDALVHARVIENDRFVDLLTVGRQRRLADGCVVVLIGIL